MLGRHVKWWIDRDAFLEEWNRASSAQASGDGAIALTAYEHAAALYRGRLFEDDPAGEWFLNEQRLISEGYLVGSTHRVAGPAARRRRGCRGGPAASHRERRLPRVRAPVTDAVLARLHQCRSPGSSTCPSTPWIASSACSPPRDRAGVPRSHRGHEVTSLRRVLDDHQLGDPGDGRQATARVPDGYDHRVSSPSIEPTTRRRRSPRPAGSSTGPSRAARTGARLDDSSP